MPPDQQHQDAVAENPFTAKNVIIGITSALVVAFICGLVTIAWNSIAGSQEKQWEKLDLLDSKIGDVKATLIVHGDSLSNIQAEVSYLRSRCMDKNDVDERIRALVPMLVHRTQYEHGAEQMVATNATDPP